MLFDDTVIDKSHSFVIAMVRRQWGGNAKAVIKGIGVVTSIRTWISSGFWIIASLIQREVDAARSTIS